MQVPAVPGFSITKTPSSIDDSADYILLLKIDKNRSIRVGALGWIDLEIGTYAYCGSAKAGLWGRVKRHFSDQARKKWHIDHITPLSSSRMVLWKRYSLDGECAAATFISERFESVHGFGCSDCSCRSHLFFLG